MAGPWLLLVAAKQSGKGTSTVAPLASPLFEDLLRRFRMAAGLTQEELAERAGLSADAISALERGARRAPRKDTVALLADALQLAAPQRELLTAAAHRRPPSSVPSPSLRSDGVLPVAGFVGALPTGLLVSREDELAQAMAALEAVTGGAGRLLLLSGEPGIGKTRLAQEVAVIARDKAFVVAPGRCYEPERTVTYYPFLEALSLAYASAPSWVRTALPDRWPDVVQLLPELQLAVTSRPSSALSSDSPMAQQRLFWSVTGFVRALASEHPVAFLLDDLHWADSASLALLVHLARHTRTERVLLLGTYRDEAAPGQQILDTLLRDLHREQLVEHIGLRPLSQNGTAALIAAAFGEGPISPDFAALLHQRTEGNPFFAHEVLRALVERGDIYRQNGGWQRRALVELRVPDNVRAVIGERVARLSESARQTLREASVLGQTFTFADFAGLRTRPEDEVEAALEEATAANLVRESDDESYTFSHVLILQTLYEALPARRKQRLHRIAGEALERLPERQRQQRVAELAYQFVRGNDAEKALVYLLPAAEISHAAGAFREEITLLDQAIMFAERLEHPTAELRARRGLAYYALSIWKAADTDLTTALHELGPDQRELRAKATSALAQIRQWLFDENANTRRLATEALALANEIGRDDLAASAISTLGVLDVFVGDLQGSLRHFEQSVARVGSEHLRETQWGAGGVEFSGVVLYWLGDLDRAIERERQALDLARQQHNVATTGSMLHTLGLALAVTGRYGEGLQAIADGERVAREYEARQWLARGLAIHGGVHLAAFDYATAQALSEEARDTSRSANWPHATISAGIDLVQNFARRQEPGRADRLIDELAQAVAGDHSHKRWLWQMRLAEARAEIALVRGEYEDTVRWAEEVIALSRLRGRVKYEALGLCTHAQALDKLGHTLDAIGDLRKAVALARSMGDLPLFLHVAAPLLVLAGDDALLAEARAAADRIASSLPEGALLRHFHAAEPVALLHRLSSTARR